jgi:hypothetical protein
VFLYYTPFTNFQTQIWEIDGNDFSIRKGPNLPLNHEPAVEGFSYKQMVVTAFRQIVIPIYFYNTSQKFFWVISSDTLNLVQTITEQELGISIFDSNVPRQPILFIASADQKKAWIQSWKYTPVEAPSPIVEMDLETLTVTRQFNPSSISMGFAVNHLRNEFYFLSVSNQVQVLHVVDLSTGFMTKQISFPSNVFASIRAFRGRDLFGTTYHYSIGTILSAGGNGLLYANLVNANRISPQNPSGDPAVTIVFIVDIEQGIIINNRLITDVFLMESMPGDFRLFTVDPSGPSIQCFGNNSRGINLKG